jgi:hypothetical protein
MSGIKLEEKKNMKEKCETKVKQEPKSVIVKEETNEVKASAASCIYLGTKAKLTELPTAKDQHKILPHQFATRLFNFRLCGGTQATGGQQKKIQASYKKTLKFVFQENPKFDLAGDRYCPSEGRCFSNEKDAVSPTKSSVRMEPLDGVQFLSLSDYSVFDLIHPKFSGVARGLSNENNVAMLFSKVSKRRCQKIDNKCVRQG